MAPDDLSYTPFKPWMCSRCGHMCDAASPTDSKTDGPPEEGDVSLCLNCGAPYTLHDGKWAPMTKEEHDRLSAHIRLELFQAELARRSVIDVDLSRKGRTGHA